MNLPTTDLLAAIVSGAIGLLIIGALSALICRAVAPTSNFLPSLIALPVRRTFRSKAQAREAISELVEGGNTEAAIVGLKNLLFLDSLKNDPTLQRLVADHNQRLIELISRIAAKTGQTPERLDIVEGLLDEHLDLLIRELKLVNSKVRRGKKSTTEGANWAVEQAAKELREIRESLRNNQRIVEREWAALIRDLANPSHQSSDVVLH